VADGFQGFPGGPGREVDPGVSQGPLEHAVDQKRQRLFGVN